MSAIFDGDLHVDHVAFLDDALLSVPPAAPKPMGRPIVSNAADLQRRIFPPIKYIVPGYLAEGCTLLAGRPKLGKSWLMLDVALAVAAGRYCLGNIQPEQGDTLYLALEDNQRRLKSRIDKILGFGVEWPRAFQFATEWLRGADGVKAIREWLEAAINPRLVIVDVLNMFRQPSGREATLYESDYLAISGLQQLASEFGVAIVIVHHTRKSAADNDPFDKVSGTLGLSGAADTTMVLDRDSNGCTLYARGRDVTEIEAAITFDRETCRWTIQGDAADVRRTDERQTILSAMKEAGEPMRSNDLADETGMPNVNIRQLLVKLARQGDVIKVKRGLYALPDHPISPDHNDHKVTNWGDDDE